MPSRALETRVEKLEARTPSPPSPYDDMTDGELLVHILECYAAVARDPGAPAEKRESAKEAFDKQARRIIDTVNFASGRWATIPGMQNYQEQLQWAKQRWERVRPTQTEYVPALDYHMEHSGFSNAHWDTVIDPELMARRAALWENPTVKEIVAMAATAPITGKMFFECKSFQGGRWTGEPSAKCAWPCARQCLNARTVGPWPAPVRSNPALH